MLEKDFTSIDDDFITLWSKFCIKEEKNPHSSNQEILRDLSTLSNLGQINAMQSIQLFYFIKTDKTKDNINKILIKLDGDMDYNDSLLQLHTAIANKENDKNISQYKKRCFQKHKLTYDLTGNPLILERYYEIKAGHSLCGLVARAGIKKLRKVLEKRFEDQPDNSAYAFAYGKNLIFFGNKYEKKAGYYILSTLARREYSQEFQNAREIEEMHALEKEEQKYTEALNFADEFCKKIFGDNTEKENKDSIADAWNDEEENVPGKVEDDCI